MVISATEYAKRHHTHAQPAVNQARAACAGARADAAQRVGKVRAVQMIDMHLPTTDGSELLLTRVLLKTGRQKLRTKAKLIYRLNKT